MYSPEYRLSKLIDDKLVTEANLKLLLSDEIISLLEASFIVAQPVIKRM